MRSSSAARPGFAGPVGILPHKRLTGNYLSPETYTPRHIRPANRRISHESLSSFSSLSRTYVCCVRIVCDAAVSVRRKCALLAVHTPLRRAERSSGEGNFEIYLFLGTGAISIGRWRSIKVYIRVRDGE